MDQEIKKIIEVKDIRKVYRMGKEKIKAVDGVSFDILQGEFCCLLGTSGSGKSTLLNLMAGIEKATSGQIIIKGKNIHKMSEKGLAKFRQKYLGFVFQSYNLMGSMTAQENVEFPLIFKRIRSKKRKKLAREMLIKVGLKSRLHHKPKEMSGGQQQRVGIARAFVAKPEIVFADEPTGNLDTKTTMEVMDLIKGIARDNKQTIVMVTHDRRLANYADKIIHILDGHIQNIEIIRDIKKGDKTENQNTIEHILEKIDATEEEDFLEEPTKMSEELVEDTQKVEKESDNTKNKPEELKPKELKPEAEKKAVTDEVSIEEINSSKT